MRSFFLRRREESHKDIQHKAKDATPLKIAPGKSIEIVGFKRKIPLVDWNLSQSAEKPFFQRTYVLKVS